MRLAFAEAAYKAEIVRLGRVLDLLAKRPEEMSESALTNVLVEQQHEQRNKQHSKRSKQLEVENCRNHDVETAFDDESTTTREVKITRTSWNRITSVATNTRKKLTKSLHKPIDEPEPIEESKSDVEKLVGFVGSIGNHILGRWTKQNKRREQKSRRNKFLAIRFNADGRGKFSVQTYDEGSVAIESDTAKRFLLREYDDYQMPWLHNSNLWALQARGLIVDTIKEAMDASIYPMNILGGQNSPSGGDEGVAATMTELEELECEWRVRKYHDSIQEDSKLKSHSNENSLEEEIDEQQEEKHQERLQQRSSHTFLPALFPSKQKATSISIPLRQWTFVHEMSRDINRLKRVGEGRSLKFKWKEVHWIHWLMQWNLVGVPSAALKIWVASWIHNNSKPYIPGILEASREAYDATLAILMTRFWTPFKGLIEELMSRRTKLVTGVSLVEEEASLDIMLKDLGLGDGTQATRHEATIQATRQYESYMKSGLMLHALGGRLARLMLIQLQQLKVSMLEGGEQIDILFQSNKLSMQLMAVIPAIGILFYGTKLVVRTLFSIRAKDLRPITSVHAEMTDNLNELQSKIILRKAFGPTTTDPGTRTHQDISRTTMHQTLGEFALTLYNYLLLCDYSSPQPFSSRQCDAIHRSLTTFLGREGSFESSLALDRQSKLLDLVQDKHRELSKSL